MIAVSFDYGQTLVELDTTFLARRALERGILLDPIRLDEGSAAAWGAYDDAKRRGEGGYEAWCSFMSVLVSSGGASKEATRSLVDFLWSEQPKQNVWRRPIPGMLELVSDLSERGVRIAVLSNSEGHLVELLEEMGLRAYFPVVADSGKLGFEKPDRRIFDFVANGLGVSTHELVHVGDAWAADVEGALGVGARAIWVASQLRAAALPEGVVCCGSPDEIRSALRAFGVPA